MAGYGEAVSITLVEQSAGAVVPGTKATRKSLVEPPPEVQLTFAEVSVTVEKVMPEASSLGGGWRAVVKVPVSPAEILGVGF